jgi:hypothetical protein
MTLNNGASSPLKDDPHKFAAAGLLIHLLQYQPVPVFVGNSNGQEAAGYCADFIETFAARLKAMKP